MATHTNSTADEPRATTGSAEWCTVAVLSIPLWLSFGQWIGELVAEVAK